MAEVYAGFSEYTDAQVGRIVDYLEETGQLDNTIVLYCADNGASGEGSPNGSVNENKFFNGFPDEMDDNLSHMDDLGSPNTYNHYPTGWAVAFSTPFKMFKRYSYAGGTCDPLVIHWPKGFRARGEVRTQYHHVTDIVPTLLDCLGLEMPDVVDGHEQQPLPGVSMRYTFDDASAATRKERQYYAMLGTRGIYADGWKAVAVHGPTSGIGHFDRDAWELFHLAEDYSEAHDLAGEMPDKVKEMVDIWFEEADKFDVLPLDDRRPAGDPGRPAPAARARPRHLHLLPAHRRGAGGGRAEHPRALVPDPRRGRGRATPEVDGVIFAHGARFGGHALFVHEGRLHYVYNFLGIPPEQVFSAERAAAAGPPRRRRVVRQGVGRPVRRGARHDEALRRRRGRGRGDDAHADRAVHALRRRALRRARLQRRGEPRSTRRPARSPAAGSSRSRSSSATTSTSTSSATRRR